MILQNIVFPKKGICEQKELFFHTEHGSVTQTKKGLLLSKDATLNLLTYFNSFSIEKWQEYTDIRQFDISLEIKGKCIIQLCHAEILNHVLTKKSIQEFTIDSSDRETHVLSFPQEQTKGIYYICLKAMGNVEFYGGGYQTSEEIKNIVDIAIGICTYRREPFVKKTLATINQTILNNEDSPLSNHLHVLVSDNGNTLPIDELNSEKIHVFYNKNAGGSGGFGRCMLEAMNARKQYGFTHILLMDDDIILEPETLHRTYALLSYVKENYRHHIIGGGLLRLDRPYLQHANGEIWHGGIISSPKGGYHLCKETDVVKNEAWIPVDHSGWWYCCIPMDKDTKHFLPMPLFIHADDIEYGLRYHRNIIFLNGIGVWHDAFDNRKGSFTAYYDIRNALICNAIHHPEYSRFRSMKLVCRHLLGQILRLRCDDQPLTIRAVKDFCKGVDFLKNQDPVALNQEIMQMGYKQGDVSDLLAQYQLEQYYKVPSDEELYTPTPFSFKEKITLNGWLLPGKKQCIPVALGAHPKFLYRRKKVLLFDPDSQKGFVTERKQKNLFITFFRCVKVCLLLWKHYSDTVKDFQKHSSELNTKEFWNKYLEL